MYLDDLYVQGYYYFIDCNYYSGNCIVAFICIAINVDHIVLKSIFFNRFPAQPLRISNAEKGQTIVPAALSPTRAVREVITQSGNSFNVR